jgi:TM2 domain-containing membrane protein YozV
MRRKKPELVLFTALIGFLGFAGIHRFIVGDIGWGILYFFTGGLCFIGTIVDAIKYRSIAFDANIKEAQRTYALVAGQTGGRY